jgi:bacteriocin biosynthesis cyclodehydratase domain-containing protein
MPNNTTSVPHEFLQRILHSSVTLVLDGLVGRITLDILIRQGFQNLSVYLLDHSASDKNAFSNCVWLSVPSKNTSIANLLKDNNFSKTISDSILANNLLACCGFNLNEYLVLKLNEIATHSDTPFLPSRFRGEHFVSGPYFDSTGSSCYHCAHLRRRGENPIALEEELFERFASGQVDQQERQIDFPEVRTHGELLANSTLIAGLVTSEIVRIITRYAGPQTINHQMSLNYVNGEFHMLRIPPVPACAHCHHDRNLSFELRNRS